jgi:putative transcriptional regulator
MGMIPAPGVRDIRQRLGMTRETFASSFGLSAAAVKEWESGRRSPDPAARTLLMVIALHPGIVRQSILHFGAVG